MDVEVEVEVKVVGFTRQPNNNNMCLPHQPSELYFSGGCLELRMTRNTQAGVIEQLQQYFKLKEYNCKNCLLPIHKNNQRPSNSTPIWAIS